MSLRMKLLSLISICALAFIVFGIVSWTTINKVKINGDVYNRIAQEKDLIADILPPPEYLVEAYLVIHQMVEETDDTKLKELVQKSKKLREEYDDRHKYWANNLPEGPLKTELIVASYKPAVEYFKIQDEQVIMAILKNDKDAARQIMRTSMKTQYEEHRLAIDKVVKMASDLLQKDEESIKLTVNSRMTLLLVLGLVVFTVIFICGFFMNYVSVSIVGRVKRISEGLNENVQLIVSSSSQIASSSQSLADGASEQASSLQETSSSVEELTSMTKQSAENVQQAKVIMGEAKAAVEKANLQMGQLTNAVNEIAKSSDETGKIIKTIDEIAFQTNLLALNAAVEAARAGEAGAGFAVVADEVRNLAMRASEAAKNTANLIEGTINAVKKGNELTYSTQEAFRVNTEAAMKVATLIDEIATASSEQANGLGQINKAVAEIDKVTQSQAAAAEESASASEELNAQAVQMEGYVAELNAVVSGSAASVPDKTQELPPSRGTFLQTKVKSFSAPRLQGGKASLLKKRKTHVDPKQVIPMDEREFKNF